MSIEKDPIVWGKNAESVWTLKLWKLAIGKMRALDSGWKLNGKLRSFYIRLERFNLIDSYSLGVHICLGKSLYYIYLIKGNPYSNLGFFEFISEKSQNKTS